ncbi:MAG: tetratricopeptide repeat protein [Candidatus Omnitrophica bacterium]|nr:tetratricopeptide repeat protein [Candidatus Omnitrophota bacterium]
MLRKFLVLFLIVLLAGCGSPKKTKYQGVEADNNYVEKGMKFLSQGDVLKAIKNFDMAIKNDPNNIKNYLTLAQVYIRLKNYPRAIDTLSAATRVDPINGDVYYLLSVSQRLNGDLKGAIDSAKKSVVLFQRSGDQDNFSRSAGVLKKLMQEAQQFQSRADEAPTQP